MDSASNKTTHITKNLSREELVALSQKLQSGKHTPVALAMVKWIDLVKDVEHHTKRLEQLRQDKSDRTMINFVSQHLAALRKDCMTAASNLSDIPARNAHDIYCKLYAATTLTAPKTDEGAALFSLAQSSQNDLDTFLNYADTQKRSKASAAG